jgi:hypothetical protein
MSQRRAEQCLNGVLTTDHPVPGHQQFLNEKLVLDPIRTIDGSAALWPHIYGLMVYGLLDVGASRGGEPFRLGRFWGYGQEHDCK